MNNIKEEVVCFIVFIILCGLMAFGAYIESDPLLAMGLALQLFVIVWAMNFIMN